MRYDAVKNSTYYIIAAPESEECVKSFKTLLNLVSHEGTENNLNHINFQHPLEAHILLCKISCDSSQAFISLFRQSMFAQVFKLYPHSLSNADNMVVATSSG